MYKTNGLFGSTSLKPFFLVVTYKCLVFLFIFCAVELLPIYDTPAHRGLIHWPPHAEPTLSSRFATWDGSHYLHLSQDGYKADDPSCAFYPLLPLLIKSVSPLAFGNHFISGLVLCNLFSLAALALFRYLVSFQHGTNTANAALIMILSFPGAIFFSFIYTESLFLLLIMVFFIGMFREKYWLAALAGFLLPLTRAIGVFCLLPLAWHLWEKAKGKMQKENLESGRTFKFPEFLVRLFNDRAWLVCLAPLLGWASYFGFMYAAAGNAFEGFEAQKNYPNNPSIANILNLLGFIQAFFDVGALHGMTNSAIDRALFILFLVCLPAIWRVNKCYFFYALGSGLIPAMSNWFFSYNRFMILCFPVFIVLAEKLKTVRTRLLFWCIVAVMGGIQIMFLIRHINFYWAG